MRASPWSEYEVSVCGAESHLSGTTVFFWLGGTYRIAMCGYLLVNFKEALSLTQGTGARLPVNYVGSAIHLCAGQSDEAPS
jgi:hypothetical protein